MKFKFFRLFLAIFFLSIFSQHLFAKDSDFDLLTTRNWDCVYTKNMIDVGRVSIKKNVQYDKNGTLKCDGNIIFNIALANGAKDKIIYYYKSNGKWSIKDNQLVETTFDTEIVNMTHPNIKENVNAKSFLTANVDNFSEIVTITGKKMELKKVKSGDMITCKVK